MPLSAQEFYRAWMKSSEETWPDSGTLDRLYLELHERNKPAWTELMCNFITKVIKSCLGDDCDIRREFRTMDFVAWRTNHHKLHNPQYGQPLNVEIVVEHENGGNVEEEFWKLAHFHCPLKVLIFYWWKYEDKLPLKAVDSFAEIRRALHSFHPQSEHEQWLFIYGKLKQPGFWKAATFDDHSSNVVVPL